MANKNITLSFLVFLGLLGAPYTALAQNADGLLDAGSIADRLNPNQRNFSQENTPNQRFKRILVQDKRGNNAHILVDTSRKITLPLRFAPGSDTLLPKAKKLLKKAGGALEELKETQRHFLIIGHTDISGDSITNQRLSLRRAMAARNYIIQNFNIRPSRLLVAGLGASNLYDQDNPSSAINRRIEIILIDRTSRQHNKILSYNGTLAPKDQLRTMHYLPQHKGYSNVVCQSYQGIKLRDIRPKHMEMDDYDARTPLVCDTSSKQF